MLRLAPVIIASELTPHITTYRKALFICTLFSLFKKHELLKVRELHLGSIIAFRAHAAVFLLSIDTFGQWCGSVLVVCVFWAGGPMESLWREMVSQRHDFYFNARTWT